MRQMTGNTDITTFRPMDELYNHINFLIKLFILFVLIWAKWFAKRHIPINEELRMLCKDKLNPKYVPNKKAFILSLFVGFNTQLWG